MKIGDLIWYSYDYEDAYGIVSKVEGREHHLGLIGTILWFDGEITQETEESLRDPGMDYMEIVSEA